MEIIRGLENLKSLGGKSVVTIGMFDGVHKGHQRIIGATIEEARKRRARSVVLTFEPHPIEVLKPGSHPPILTSTELKAELIEALGVDIFLVVNFTKGFANLSPKEFIDHIILKLLDACCLVVGETFKFGKNAEGDVTFLKEYRSKRGFDIISIPLLEVNGKFVSSTYIRELLREGELQKVKEILGRYPRIIGEVIKGCGRGKSLGFCTANLRTVDKASIPKRGVYAGFIEFNGERKMCTINIGTSPTFGGRRFKIETFIIDFKGDLYRKRVELEICARIRDEKTFRNEKELANQIREDIEVTKSLLFTGFSEYVKINRRKR
ncbi:MAG: bifunctional riboflavin kinase/FAD synthetase [Actinomycetota bacterium]|nr:bifunctional riboflavin kinase/FAD synthetase [Actinomycetota bacterium]MDI6822083.1 bifunctional riboflavin kinase/FAD synthetase [Actinomycetota bacterium]